jgi:hypothetical protein
MRISRRGFLEYSTMMAAASATAAFPTIVPAADDTTITAASHPDVIARLSLDDAKFFVGSGFLVHPASGTPIRFVCVSVKPVPESKISTSPGHAFAMRFLPQRPVSLKQGTYAFEHPVLGKFRLFVVPSGPGVTPRYYTAIINHSTS